MMSEVQNGRNNHQPISTTTQPVRLIETNEFPFEFISALAERESWRKEIYRPVYHIHKWWAKRLGSIFRGILLGSVLPPDTEFKTAFYQSHDLKDTIIFDPFMGSGTTIGEAHKLGMTAFGRDINPIAAESVRIALTPIDRQQLKSAFQQVATAAGRKIRQLYQAQDAQGNPCDVLYYFWVKQVPCPACKTPVDLFSTYMFAQNAYPKKKPEVHVCCPICGDIIPAFYYQTKLCCHRCKTTFNPKMGTTRGAKATCGACRDEFSIIDSIREITYPPTHRLYAKMILSSQGEKIYLPTNDADHQAYLECEHQLAEEEANGLIQLPTTTLFDGYNTRQAMKYNYQSWRDFFNARQLLALGWLQESIMQLPENAERDALLTLFSGTLEFNNMFASYKGEGTGAVRHMFSHHTLKPEKMPLEANVWGTSKSSGSFSGLFKSRLLRALDYRDAPFEIGLNKKQKIFDVAKPMANQAPVQWNDCELGQIALSCGDSATTQLPDQSVDLVITDPPFFDNVHYSQLADFFHAWQVLYPRGFIQSNGTTTRHQQEVQDTDPKQFALKLQQVFSECHRVLQKKGLLIFTYHHSHPNGWSSLANAVYGSGFTIVQAHPVRADLAAATPKSQTKEPILIDAIIVCRKQENDPRQRQTPDTACEQAFTSAINQIRRLVSTGYTPTEGDKFVIGASQFFVALGSGITADFANQAFTKQQNNLRNRLNEIDVEALEPMQQKVKSMNGYQQLNLALSSLGRKLVG